MDHQQYQKYLPNPPLLAIRNTKKNSSPEKFCPICKYQFPEFKPFGIKLRRGARCPKCNSLERHRLAWLFLHRKTDFFNEENKTMLHVAPENCLKSRFETLPGIEYRSVDIDPLKAMDSFDICDMPYSSQSFDVIYCSHVLEHIENDGGAIQGLSRVLKNNGWAIISVPIIAEVTFQVASAITSQLRTELYGQPDHVRAYGFDFPDILKANGFAGTTVFSAPEIADSEEIFRMGLTAKNDYIFFCKK